MPHTATPVHTTGYQGPERRGNGLAARLLTLMLDEVDYGLLLLHEDRHVVHANHAARAELRGEHPLQLLGGELRTRCARDIAPLHEALHKACRQGLRRMLSVGEDGQRIGLSVVPMAPAGQAATALVMLGRPQVSALSVQAFARAHGLSPGEEQVLRALCDGLRPSAIAERNGVKIATVRTQIASVRAKTQAQSIRDLVQQVARLPPLVGALRSVSSLPEDPGHWARAA